MSNPINKNLFLVKEHVGLFKAASNYDIHDPETGEVIMECTMPVEKACASAGICTVVGSAPISSARREVAGL